MPLPKSFEGRLRLPVVAAPMFLVSGPQLVIEACKAGVVGTFPALNQRTTEGFEQWCAEIEEVLAAEESNGRGAAPWGVNLIVHHTNPRVQADLEVIVRHRVPLVITSLGAVSDLVDAVHGYGGVVFHDVTNIRHARKAAGAGVDGLIAVCAGAGGHAGTLSPFALVPEIRSFFDGTILLAGAIGHGSQVAAAQCMGADLAYLGTRFINTRESLAGEDYRQMIVDAVAADIVYTPAVSGVPANFLRESLQRAGYDPEASGDMDIASKLKPIEDEAKAWKTIWSAGQGVGSIADAPSVAELVDRLDAEHAAALTQLTQVGRLEP